MVVVSESEVLEAFLDSLTASLENNPAMRVRRSPQDSSLVSYRALSKRLLDEGLALISATHVFIQYRFEWKNDEIVETIEDLHFIYRENPAEEDISLLHVAVDTPTVRDVLIHSGIPSEVNMQTVTPFRRFLAFPRLVQEEETTVVRMSGRPVRDDYQRHQRTLLEYLNGFVKHRGIGYTLSTAHDSPRGEGR